MSISVPVSWHGGQHTSNDMGVRSHLSRNMAYLPRGVATEWTWVVMSTPLFLGLTQIR